MQQTRPPVDDLPFSGKYDREHAHYYLTKHQTGLARRLSTWREIQMARKALDLAGQPGVVLDLPCGVGRFWSLLKEKKNRTVIAADYSEDMLAVAREAHPWHQEQDIRCLQTSAFDIDLPDSSVDSVLCMRLLHHIGSQHDRSKILQELHRVSRDTVIVSLWVDGNYKAWRRARNRARRKEHGTKKYQNRFVLPRKGIEREFTEAGFEIVGHIDFLPLYQMWRFYILRKR